MGAFLAVLLVGGAGWYLWRTGALDALTTRPGGLLMNPPEPPTPTAPTSRTSGFGGAGGLIGGITAAAGLLVYGIVEKGWFRGGEEGVKVNPARDDFFSQFATYARSKGANLDYSWQGPAAAWVLGTVGGVDGNVQNALITQMYEANTVDEYVSAAKAFADILEPRGFHVAIPM